MPGPSKVIVLDPDPRAGRQVQLGFEREGVRTWSLDPGKLELEGDDPGLIVVGGADGRGLELVQAMRKLLDDKHLDAPIIFAGKGVRRTEVEAAGADEVVLSPAYLRDVVTIGRLLLGLPGSHRGHLIGSLAETTGVYTLVRALSALGRSAVLTLIRGLRRGEVRFYHGEVTSAQVGLIHGQAALHQLLLWTDARFDFHHEDVVRRQQIPLSSEELFADAERFLEGVRDESGKLSPSNVLEQDVARVQNLGKQIPTEVHGVLRMFDGHRVLADVLEDSPYRVFETLRVAQRAVEAGLLRVVDSPRPKATWRAVLAIEEWLVGGQSRAAVIERLADIPSSPVAMPFEKPESKNRGSRRQRKKRRANTPLSVQVLPAKIEIDWGSLVPRVVGAEVGPLSGVVPATFASGEIDQASRELPREGLEALMDTNKRTKIFPTDIGLEPSVVFDEVGERERADREKAEREAAETAKKEAKIKDALARQARDREEMQGRAAAEEVMRRAAARPDTATGAAAAADIAAPTAPAPDAAAAAAAASDTATTTAAAADTAAAAATATVAPAAATEITSGAVTAPVAATAKAKADRAKADHDASAKAETSGAKADADVGAAAKAKTDADAAKARADADAVKAKADADAAKAKADADAAAKARADADGAAKAKADADAAAKARADADAAAKAKADADAAAKAKADADAAAKAKADADAAKARADADAAKAKADADAAAKAKADADADAKANADADAAAKAKADADAAAKAKADADAKAQADAAKAKADADAKAKADADAKAQADADAKAKADVDAAAKAKADAEAEAAAKVTAEAAAAQAKIEAAAAKAKAEAEAKAENEARAKAEVKAKREARLRAEAEAEAAEKAQREAEAAAKAEAKAKADADAKAKADAEAAEAKAKADADAKVKAEAAARLAEARAATLAIEAEHRARAEKVAALRAIGDTVTASEPTSATDLVKQLLNERSQDAKQSERAQAKQAHETERLVAEVKPIGEPTFLKQVNLKPNDADAAQPPHTEAHAKSSEPSNEPPHASLEAAHIARSTAPHTEPERPVTTPQPSQSGELAQRSQRAHASRTGEVAHRGGEEPADSQIATVKQTALITVAETASTVVTVHERMTVTPHEDSVVVSSTQVTTVSMEVTDEPSDGVVHHIASAETAPLPHGRELHAVPINDDDRPRDTGGEISQSAKAPEPATTGEPSILVSDIAAVHTAINAVVAAQAAAQPSPEASTSASDRVVSEVRKDAVSFSDAEEAFFSAAEPAAKPPPPIETFEDLDKDYQPVGFWDRLVGRKPKKKG